MKVKKENAELVLTQEEINRIVKTIGNLILDEDDVLLELYEALEPHRYRE